MKQAALDLNLSVKKTPSASSWSRWSASLPGRRWSRILRRAISGGGARRQWHFGMKARTAVDANSALVPTVRGMAGHVADVTEGNALLHGQETAVFADARYQGADKRPDANPTARWRVAMRAGKRTRQTAPSMRSSARSRSSRQVSAAQA